MRLDSRGAALFRDVLALSQTLAPAPSLDCAAFLGRCRRRPGASYSILLAFVAHFTVNSLVSLCAFTLPLSPVPASAPMRNQPELPRKLRAYRRPPVNCTPSTFPPLYHDNPSQPNQCLLVPQPLSARPRPLCRLLSPMPQPPKMTAATRAKVVKPTVQKEVAAAAEVSVGSAGITPAGTICSYENQPKRGVGEMISYLRHGRQAESPHSGKGVPKREKSISR
ncbi:hypothetical protein C8R46DRAFT_1071822 [Mycena filopes]|nr:hypothetical protein C8R46DRAFT_1071822 [Mycena filopes]